MRKTFNYLFLFAYAAGLVFCQEQQAVVEFHFLTPPRTLFGLPGRIDPDEPLFEYANVAGTWRAKMGGAITLFGISSDVINSCVSLNAFLQLYNFSENQPVSWEALRADIGLMLFFEFPPLNRILFRGSRIMFETGFFHQDGNVIDLTGYESVFLNAGYSLFDLPYSDFNSFEYIHCRITFSQEVFDGGLFFFISGGFKKLGSLFAGLSIRKLDVAWTAEAGLALKIIGEPETLVWLSLYFEDTKNGFVSDAVENPEFSIGHYMEDFIYISIDAGIEFRNESGFSVKPFIGYVYHHGKGVDFLKLYQGAEWGIKISF